MWIWLLCCKWKRWEMYRYFDLFNRVDYECFLLIFTSKMQPSKMRFYYFFLVVFPFLWLIHLLQILNFNYFEILVCFVLSCSMYATVSTLKYGIVVQVGINIQVGIFLQKNKCTSWNKRTGGNFQHHCFSLNMPISAYHFILMQSSSNLAIICLNSNEFQLIYQKV